MIELIKNILLGIFIGLILAYFIEIRVKSFLKKMKNNSFSKTFPNSKKNLILLINTKFLVFFLVFTTFLTSWRELSPYLFNDLVFLTTLTLIARIDFKTMYIDGQIITFALLIRLLWLMYFEPQEIHRYLAGLFFGAGILYIIGFVYQTFRKQQGLGDGDASVLGLIGFWLGWQDLGIVIFISAFSGIIISIFYFLKIKDKQTDISILLKTKIPFAPFLCFGGLFVYLLRETNYFNIFL